MQEKIHYWDVSLFLFPTLSVCHSTVDALSETLSGNAPVIQFRYFAERTHRWVVSRFEFQRWALFIPQKMHRLKYQLGKTILCIKLFSFARQASVETRWSVSSRDIWRRMRSWMLSWKTPLAKSSRGISMKAILRMPLDLALPIFLPSLSQCLKSPRCQTEDYFG